MTFKYRPMNPTDTSQLDVAHSRFEEVMQEIIDQVGAAEAEEALVCALVMSSAFDVAAIRKRIDAHLALDDAFEDAGIEEGEDDDWDELQDDGKPNYFADNTGGKFD